MIKPKRLKKGDTIAIVAPSGPLDKNKVEQIKRNIISRGYNIKVYESCYSIERGYLSGDDRLRAKDLQSAFLDKNVDAIFCLRGGYGAIRILDLIDFDIIKNNPKIFLGISDITALHIVFNQICNLITYHGPLAQKFIDSDNYTEKSLLDNISTDNQIVFENQEDKEIETFYGGKSEGKIVGGNLSVINTTLGTKYEIDTKDKILFLEEVNEYAYSVDRMINHLHMAGKFKDCRGIIFGDFCNCNKVRENDWPVRKILREISELYKKPTIYNLQSGHCKSTGTIPLGSICNLDADNKSVRFNYYNCM